MRIYFTATVFRGSSTRSLASEFQLPESRSKLCYDRRSVGQSLLVSGTHLWPKTKLLLLLLLLSVVGLLTWGNISDESTGLSFTVAAGPSQRSHSRIRVPRVSWPYFTVSDSRLPNLEGQVLAFISRWNRVIRLLPQELGSRFVAFYDSQGYSGAIRPASQSSSVHKMGTGRIENISNSVSCVSVCCRRKLFIEPLLRND
jgi:hypothetical protein